MHPGLSIPRFIPTLIGALAMFGATTPALAELPTERPGGPAIDLPAGPFDLRPIAVPTELKSTHTIQVQLDDEVCHLDLVRTSTFAPGAVIRLYDGDTFEEIPAPASGAYRGTIREHPGSVVAAAIGEAGLKAWAVLDDDTFRIQPFAGDVHTVYRNSLQPKDDQACGINLSPDVGPAIGAERQPQVENQSTDRATSAGTGVTVAELAIDVDYEYFEARGFFLPTVVQDVEALVAYTNIAFDLFNIDHLVTAVVVRTTPDDPFQSPTLQGSWCRLPGTDVATFDTSLCTDADIPLEPAYLCRLPDGSSIFLEAPDDDFLLAGSTGMAACNLEQAGIWAPSETRVTDLYRWWVEQDNLPDVSKDIVHLLSGIPLPPTSSAVGLAGTGVVCNPAVGATLGIKSDDPPVVMAHELGHNWNAAHCDQQMPPITPCYGMCSFLNGCDPISPLLFFGPWNQDRITAFAATLTCLDTAPVTAIWVDFGYPLPPGSGTPSAPFQTFGAAHAAAFPGAEILFVNGSSSPETGTFDTPVTARPFDGKPVTIGQ